MGDLTLSAASGSERGEVQVNSGVANFTKEVESKAGIVNKRLISMSCKRAGIVDGEGADEAREGPVEGTVLEDVSDGHRVGRELVDKEGFDLALNKVGNNHVERKPLRRGQWCVATGVDVGADSQNSEVDEDRAEVFENEDASPRDLGACTGASNISLYNT